MVDLLHLLESINRRRVRLQEYTPRRRKVFVNLQGPLPWSGGFECRPDCCMLVSVHDTLDLGLDAINELQARVLEIRIGFST